MGKNDWGTPRWLYNALNAEFGFDMDPCPLRSDVQLAMFEDWGGGVFVNPPYELKACAAFLEKAVLEIQSGRVRIAVFLLPAWTDRSWWHDWVLSYAAELRFYRGRIRFEGDRNDSATFPSVVVVFTAASVRKKGGSVEIRSGLINEQGCKQTDVCLGGWCV